MSINLWPWRQEKIKAHKKRILLDFCFMAAVIILIMLFWRIYLQIQSLKLIKANENIYRHCFKNSASHYYAKQEWFLKTVFAVMQLLPSSIYLTSIKQINHEIVITGYAHEALSLKTFVVNLKKLLGPDLGKNLQLNLLTKS